MNSTYLLFFSIIILFGSTLQSIVDDGLSPQERFEQGQKIEGAYNASSPLHCSPGAKNRIIPNVLNDGTPVSDLQQYSNVTVASMLTEVNGIINETQNLLLLYNDSKVANRHTCSGFYVETDSHFGNALSLTAGYIIFDHKMFQYLFSLPDDKRSSWVFDFLALHEYAHQLQYWNEDKEVRKTLLGQQSSKIPELTADCVAGALLALNNQELPDHLYAISINGALGAAESLGDYDTTNPAHHGTPEERKLATSFGANLVRSSKVGLLTGSFVPTSTTLIHTCNQFVKSNLNH